MPFRFSFAFAILTLVLAACTPTASPTPTSIPASATVTPAPGSTATTTAPEATKTKSPNPTNTAPPPTGKVLFTLTRPDGSTMDFTSDMLKALPQGTILLAGTPNEGPILTEIINAAGVTDFTEVTLTGSKGAVTFQKAELTDKYLLDFTNRGTLKPVWLNAPQPTTVGDVNAIALK